jgi:hypothetical protein
LYIPFCSGQNGRKISYWYANRYEAPPCSTSAKVSAHFGLFWPDYSFRSEYFLGFQFSVPNLILISRSLGFFSALISRSLLSLLITPPVCLHGSTSYLQLQPSTSYKAASSNPASAFNNSTTSQPPPFKHITADLLLFRLQIFGFSISDLSLFYCCCFAPLPTVSSMDI